MNETILFQQSKLRVAENMIKYGGGFFRHIGHAILHASFENGIKIMKTWPREWAKYRDMS